MKKFSELSKEELDKMEGVYRIYLKNINNMIDLLTLEPVAFKTVFEKIFEDNIKNRNSFKKKMEG